MRGHAGETTLTGTIYEPDGEPPQCSGPPDATAPSTWVRDECDEVESGGTIQEIDGLEIHVAFESLVSRGFESREAAVAAATEPVRTQFARLDVADASLEVVTSPG